MSKTNLALGERVQLIPFKHKGKVGSVQYIGEIEGKNSGNWVGIELDEPQGDCDGDINGTQIFECRPSHGLFLRPTQVKSLSNPDVSKITDQSSIMNMNESLVSGMENMGSLIGNSPQLDLNQIETNLNQDPTEVRVQDVDGHADSTKSQTTLGSGGGSQSTQQESTTPAESNLGGGGRVRGWKERLAKLREQKEQEKKTEESKLADRSQDQSQDNQADQDLAKVKDIFAPAQGLERNKAGKIQVDKEKVVEKADLEPELDSHFKEKDADRTEELKREKEAKGSRPQPSASADKSGVASSPAKPRMTLMERQAAKDAEKRAQGAASTTPAKDERPGTTGSAGGGLKAPSRLARPTAAASGLKATEERKQKLLEKQKAVNARMEEKAKATADKGGTTTRIASARGVQPAEGGTATTRTSLAQRSRLAGATGRPSEEAKTSRLTAGRKSISGVLPGRLGAGRASARPSLTADSGDSEAADKDKPASGAATSRTGTSRARGTSATKDKDLQFGSRRNTSASREKDGVQGLSRARGSSQDKNKDGLQFGRGAQQTSTTRGSSKERIGLSFGKTAAAEPAKLDPSMTTIKKQELQDLREDNEKNKEDLYNINIKLKKVENQCEVLKRDHKDQIETLTHELNEKHTQAHQELIQKHSEERNELIRESNKSTDSKFTDLKREFDALQTLSDELDQKLKQTIEDMTDAHKQNVEALALTGDKKFEEMKAELDAQVQEHKEQLANQNDKMVQVVEKVQNQKSKTEELAEQIQANKIDMEANQLEIEMLREEKQELLAEMMDNSKLEQEDILNTLSTDEIKQQNRKLRQAVTSLAQGFEAEKAKLMKQIEDEEGKKKIIADYEKKLQDMDVLLEELDRKEEELAEMKIENEMCLEYETMVEEMAQEILKKEEELEEVEKKNKGLEEILGIQEGYGENLEQYNQELTEELAEKEGEFNALENQKVEDEELLLDLEDENQKYRDKVQQQTKTIKELTEQLEQYTSNSDEKNKLAQLVEKQNNLTKQLQENEKLNLDNKLKKIDYHWQNALKSKVIEGIIPARLQEDVHFDSLDKLNVLNQSMHRAMLMFRYICEKQLPNVENMYGGGGEEELQKKIQFVKMMITLGEQSILFINSAQRILVCVNNMSVEQYIKATTTLMAWKKFEAVSTEMGFIIEKLKDENLSLIFDTSELQGHIKQVLELHFKIEKLFIEKTPEEVALEKPSEKDKEDDNNKYTLSPAQLERQKMTQNCHKLDLRNQSMRMCVAITALQVIFGGVIEGGSSLNHNFIKKGRLVYGRLLDIIFKLDHVDAEDTGKEYLNMQDLVTDKRFSEKYDVIKIIWSDVADPEQIQSKDWNSLLDAIQRDITQLFNDYKFKRLITHIKNSYKEQDKDAIANLDEIFFIDRFQNDSSPWMEISKKIRTDIQNSEALKDKIETLNTKNREALKQNMQQDRTINTLKVTTKSLEQRLATAQTKIEELNQTKGENEQLTKKQVVLKKQVEASIKELENLKKYQDEMQKKYEALEKKATEGAVVTEQQASYQENLGNFRKAKGLNQQSRQSRTSTWFQELAKTSMLGGRKLDSTMTPQNVSAARGGNIKPINSVEVQKHLQAQEENYSNIIYQLQQDRMRLRGKDVTEKLNRLQKSDGALNQFIRNQGEKKNMNLKLSRDDQNQLTKAVENVENLRTNVKLQMACVKVVDLKKKQDMFLRANEAEKQADEDAKHSAFKRNQKAELPLDNSQFKPDCVRTNMNINYMIIQAREEVNSALKTLMSKDSKLTTLHIEKMSRGLEEEARQAQASTDDDSLSDDPEEPGEKADKDQMKAAAPKVQNTIQIGQIQIKSTSGDGITDEKANIKTKNIVFNVKSLRALQQNMGVFSV